MVGWKFLFENDRRKRDIAGSGRNVRGSALVTATLIADHALGARTAIAGVYRFRFETLNTVSCRASGHYEIGNPLLFADPRAVIADWVSENQSLLPGWSVKLAGDAQIGDEFEIGVGCYFDPPSARWIRALSFGPKIPGWGSTETTVEIQNIADGDQINCRLVVTNAIRVVNNQIPSGPFKSFRQVGLLHPDADHDLKGKNISFENFVKGTPNKVNILVSGTPVDVFDVTGAVLAPGGVGIKCDGSSIYRFADGTKYQSGEFILSDNLMVDNTASIFVSDGGEFIDLASESGSWTPGAAGIELTGGSHIPGTVASNAVVTFRLQVSPKASTSSALNMRSFSLRAEGTEV